MAASNIIDLDDLLPADKKVRIRGKVYTLPGDLPVELYLRITRFAQTDASEDEVVEKMHDEILELFRYGDPKLTELPLTLTQLMLLIARVYGNVDGDTEAPARPPRKSRSGGATKTSPSRSKSRSRR